SLRNPTSLYLALQSSVFNEAYDRLRVSFALDDDLYTILVRPDQLRVGTIRQNVPVVRERDTAINLFIQDDVVELRFPLEIAAREPQQVKVTGVQLLDSEGAQIAALPFEIIVPLVLETDGAVYADGKLGDDFTPFYVAGALAQGASYWTASGRITNLTPQPGDTVTIDLDVTLLTPDLALDTTDLTMLGELSLQPLSVSALHTNNGWSSLLTHSGVAIDNLRGDVMVGQTSTDWTHITRLTDRLVFGLRFKVQIPGNLPEGIYVPTFNGFVQTSDGAIEAWTANGPFGVGAGISRLPLTRIPVALNIGSVSDNHMYWSLFYDTPSDGSRGMLADEDAGQAALSNRVKFNSPTYILPPGAYPVEPYLPNFLPDAYDSVSTPLIPLLFPGGRLALEVTRPDGSKDNPGSIAVVQNRLSTDSVDERTRFGAQSPVDLYRLTTLNPVFTAYNFNLYGDYTVKLSGQVEDRFSNRYSGGGTYHLLIAELMDLVPGILPGTPFEVGNIFYPGLHLTPGLPADVTVKVRVFPLDGSNTIEQTFTGITNAYGHYVPDAQTVFKFETPGEYIVDYEARYTDANGRLWAASLRSAGVIAKPDSTLIAHGERGLQTYQPTAEADPAWFTTKEYPKKALTPVDPRLQYPYQSGDIAYYQDDKTSGIRPILQVQDLAGNFSAWLGANAGNTRASDALPLDPVSGASASGLPSVLLPETITSEAYGFVSSVRPGVTVRQFVQGNDSEALAFNWDAEDPLNGQIGAGANGDKTGDYVFLFGGTIVHNADAGIDDSSIYASLGVTGFIDGDPLGVRVYPPFRGMDGG
ncbi:MAG TPA: hypothetical protein VHL11_00005, partial [Phototrophicaceae bacterium]|nr:hypothetical protein [Phototrophicaceae bacterium]